MSVTLSTGLSDTSRELGETVTNNTSSRVSSYNDAVQTFFNEKKWPFARKSDATQTTTSGTQTYTIPMSDWRAPGGIYKIKVGSTTHLPIDEEDKERAENNGGAFFYLNELDTQVTFLKDITTTGTTITYYYYAVPTRITDTTSGVFALLPDRCRKVVAYLTASFVLRGRHMNGEANDRFKLYQLEVKNMSLQQSERNTNHPRTFGHYLKHLGWRRTYP